VLPKDQLFSEGQTPATAAVLLSGSPTALDAGAVRGIASLVSASVQGLKPQNVSITDSTGQLLWPTGDGGGDPGAVPTKQSAQSRYDAQLGASLSALIAQTVGPDKARVQVTSDLDVDQASQEKLTYAKKGIALEQHKDLETLRGRGGVAGGGAGSQANMPGYATGGAAGGNSNYRHTTTDTKYGVDKTVTRTKIAPGTVNRLSVALVVDQSVPPAQVTALRQAVAGAAGILPARGDTLAVSRVAFVKPKTTALSGPVTSLLPIVKYAALGIALLAMLLFAVRQLRRRERESLGEPTWLRQIETPMRLAELEQETTVARMPAPVAAENQARQRAEELAARDPERVAQQIRNWLRED
jgi:flagellar M-ring protein FliF